MKFWGEAVEKWTVNEIIDVLSVTGGVPRYLEELSVSLSSSENIRRLCFLPNAVLRTDFDKMFTDVITRQPRYTADVLRHLVDGAKTTTELAGAMGVEKGGRISDALRQLEEAGFVSSDGGGGIRRPGLKSGNAATA